MKKAVFFAVAISVILTSVVGFSAGPRFKDNRDGSVTDDMTGLVWEKNTDGRKKTWAQSASYCQNLRKGGLRWRLPRIDELETIVALERKGFLMDPVFSQQDPAFTKAGGDIHFWSSTGQEYDGRLDDYVWIAEVKEGGISYVSKKPDGSIPSYVKCIAGPEKWPLGRADDYIPLNREILRDQGNGSMWQTASSSKGLNWLQAEQYCRKSRTGGFSDWRLPEYFELQMLIHYSKKVNNKYLGEIAVTGDSDSQDFWTKTNDMNKPNQAWSINTLGFVSSSSKGEEMNVRCVRFSR